MRIYTKLASGSAATGPVLEETYVTGFGVGRLLIAGELPIEHHLPAGVERAMSRLRRSSQWTLALERYFAGEPESFPLDVDALAAAWDCTPFERDVYHALARVPYGTVVTYRDLAAMAGRPNAYRAVGSALARNRLPVILPCHRVVLSDGCLGQYGDDPSWKARLLALEGLPVAGGRLA